MTVKFTPSGSGYDVFEDGEHIGFVHKGICPFTYSNTESWKAVSKHLPTRDATWHNTRKGAVASLQLINNNRKAAPNA